MSTDKIENFPDFDTYLKLLDFEFDKKASMCQGTKTMLIYKKPGMMVQLWIDNDMSLLEGVKIEKEEL